MVDYNPFILATVKILGKKIQHVFPSVDRRWCICLESLLSSGAEWRETQSIWLGSIGYTDTDAWHIFLVFKLSEVSQQQHTIWTELKYFFVFVVRH